MTRSFEWWEIALLKVCLVSLGIVVGTYWYAYLAGLLWVWLALFAVTAAYFIGRFFQGK